MLYWAFLFLAIAFEVTATSLMKYSHGFTRFLPTLGTILGYILCFTLLGLSLKKVPLSIAYAIWAALGVVIITLISTIIFKEPLGTVKIICMVLIAVGVVGLKLS